VLKFQYTQLTHQAITPIPKRMEAEFVDFVLGLEPGFLWEQFHFRICAVAPNHTVVDLRYHLGDFTATGQNFVSITTAVLSEQALDQVMTHILTLGVKISIHSIHAVGYYSNF